MKKDVWNLRGETCLGREEGEVLGEWMLKNPFSAHQLGRKIIEECVLADRVLKKEDFLVTPMHILVGDTGIYLIRETLDCPEQEKEKLIYAFYEDTGSHYFAAGRLLLCLLSYEGIRKKDKKRLINVTEKAFLEQDFAVFYTFFDGDRRKHGRKKFGKSLIYYASAFAAALFLIFQGGTYKKKIAALKGPEKTVECVKKAKKRKKTAQTQKDRVQKDTAETPEEAFADVAEACLFTLKEPELALKYLERSPDDQKAQDIRALCLDMTGENTLQDQAFQEIMERRCAELHKQSIPLDGAFEICLRRDTKGSLQMVKTLGQKVLDKKDSETDKIEKEKIKRYIVEAEQ